MYDIEEMEARILEGSTLLSKYQPDWYKMIDLNELDMRNTFDCVLGQVFYYGWLEGSENSPFQQGKRSLGLDVDAARAHGFDMPVSASYEEWDELLNIWYFYIQDLQENSRD